MLKRIVPWTVRIATVEDEGGLYDALVALYADNSVAGSYTPDSVRAQIRKGASEADRFGGMIGIIDAPGGTIAATIGVFPSNLWYSHRCGLVELWLFVRPEYRHLGLHAKLFEFAKAYRDAMREQLGYKIELITSVASEKRLDAKIRLWSRFGRQLGAFFLVGD